MDPLLKPANDMENLEINTALIPGEPAESKPKMLSEPDLLEIIRELQKKQAELEMQNEVLMQAKADATAEAEKYFNIYNLSSTPYITLSKTSEIVELNLRGAQILGKDRSALKNKGFGTLISQKSRAVLSNFLEKVMSGTSGANCELELLTDPAKSVYVHISGLHLTGQQNFMLSLVESGEQKEAERKQKELHYSLVKIADCLPGVAYQYRLRPDGSSCFPYASEALFEIYHIRPQDVSQDASVLMDIIHPDDIAGVIASIQESARSLQAWQHEYRVKFADGRIRKLYGKAMPQQEPDGSVLWYGFISDITDRTKVSDSLLESEHMLRESQKVAQLGSYSWNMESGIWNSSKIMDEIFGIDENYTRSLEGWINIIHPEWQSRMDGYIADEVIGKHQRFDKEYQIIRQTDGASLWVHGLGELEFDSTNNKPLKMVGTISDITESRLAREALRNEHRRMEGIIEATQAGTWEWNVQTGETTFNREWAQIIGYTPDELAPTSIETWKQHAHPGDLLQSALLLEKHFAGELPYYDFECRMKHKQGHWVWVHDRGQVITRTAEGLPLMMFGTHTDISRRKLSEELLQESNEKHRSLVENISDVIYSLDTEGKFTYISPVIYKIIGLHPDEIVGMNFSGFIHPDDLPFLMESLQKTLKGEAEPCEFRAFRGEQVRYVRTSSQLVLHEGVVTGLTGIMTDITNSKQAEVLLQQTRQNYETFFNTIDEFLFVLDEQGCVIHTNNTVSDRLGYDTEELQGQSVLMLHPAARRDEAGRIVGEMLQGITEFCPVPLITKSGVQIPVETRVKHGTWDGKPVIFGVTKDISKIRLSEEKFSKSFQLNPSACGLSDLDNLQYIEVNEAFYSLFGFGKDEVLGKTALELGILTIETRNSILHQSDSEGNVRNIETGLRAKNGDIKHVLLSSENITVQDKTYRFTVAHDITERKLAEEALRVSSQKWEAIISASPDGIGMVAPDGTIQLMSHKVAAMYGYPLEQRTEVVGKSIFDFIDPSNHLKLTQNIQMLLSGETSHPITEYLAIRKDQSRFYIDVNSTVLLDPEGKPESILFVERDISDRKHAQEALQDSELRYRRLFETSPSGIIVLDVNGIILEANDTFTKSTQISHDDLIGIDIRELTLPETKHLVSENIKRICLGEVIEQEVISLRKDGTFCTVLLRETAITLPDGQQGILSVSNDITLRKQAEEELRTSEEKFRELFESNTDGITIFLVNPHGPPSNIVDMNENAALMVGYTKAEMMQMTPDALEKDITSGKIETRKNELLSKGFTHFETIILHRDGHEIHVEIKVKVINYHNQPAIMNIARDITERKNNETLLYNYANELSKQNVEKDKFFSIIAHDLRSPFTGFLGLTEIMAEGLHGMTLDEIQNIAVEMKNSAVNLFNLLGNLLDWSRMQRGLTTYVPVSFPLLPVIPASLVLVLEEAARKSITVSYQIPPGLEVFADENMLEGILRNLLTNAVKFTPRGGQILISAKTTPGNLAEISIQDTGIGMNKSITDNLFRLDVNTSRTGTEGESSTGLGLIICRDFIEMHGGELKIESEEGKGSTFHFTIPGPESTGTEPTVTKAPDTANGKNPVKKLKILIAEDDETSEMLLSIALKKYSSKIYRARSGKEAVEICLANPDIDLVMMDIQMPEMDGIEASRQIRQFSSTVVIIAQTAYGLDGERAKSLSAGCNDYLPKPLNKLILNTLIKKHFRI